MAVTCLDLTKDSVIKEDMKELSKSNEILRSPNFNFKGEIKVVFIYLLNYNASSVFKPHNILMILLFFHILLKYI